MKVKNDHRMQLIFQFKQLEKRSLEKSGLHLVEALIFSVLFFPIA